MSRPSYEEGSEILFSESQSIIAGTVASTFAAVGAVSNLLTIAALLYSKTLRSHPITMFLVSLAVSDLIFSVFNLPLQAHRYFHRGCEFSCLPSKVCRYVPFFLFGNVGVSMFIMAMVACHRFCVIYFPFHEKVYFNKVTVPVMIVFIWLTVFGMLQLPMTGTYGQFGYEPQTFTCTIVEKEGNNSLPLFAIAGFIVPCIFISVSYILIYLKVKATGRAARRMTQNDYQVSLGSQHDIAKHGKDRERNLTRTLVLLFVAFLVCFLPFSIVTVVDPMPPSDKSWLHLISYFLTWSSAFTNPLIYCFKVESFQKAYKDLIFDLCWKLNLRSQYYPTPTTQSTDPSITASVRKRGLESDDDMNDMENEQNVRITSI